MNRTMIITKYFLKNAFSEMFGGGKSKLKTRALVAGIVLSVLIMSFPLSMVVYGLYGVFAKIGQAGYLISFILLIDSTILLFLGIYNVLNVFYFSDDIQEILPLPFKSEEIVFGKFLTVMINMYIYQVLFVAPMIVYGVCAKMGILYYLYSLISLVVMPVFPLVIASAMAMLLMRFTSLSKHKDLFRTITGIISLVLIILFNLFSQGNANNSTEELAMTVLQGNNKLMDTISDIFITNKLTANALLFSNKGKGILYFLTSIAVLLVIYIIYYKVVGKIYLQGIVGYSETYSKREKILSGANSSKYIKETSPLKALIAKDMKIILRTPQFFMNCIAMILYMPAIFLITGFNGGISSLRQSISQGKFEASYILVIVFSIIILCITSGGAATTAISREGRDVMVSKYIPIPYKLQIQGKLILSFIINGIILLFVGIFLVFLKVPSVTTILSILVGISTVLMVCIIEVYADYFSPRVNWEDEKAVTAKNYTPLLVLLVMFTFSVIFFVIAYFVKNIYVCFAIMMVILLGISYGVYIKLMGNSEKFYNEIE